MSTVAVKERPILFSGDMVRAILDGRKTQTRRIVKPQPDHCTTGVIDWKKIRASNEHSLAAAMASACPYGQPGDRLWVRETWGIQDVTVCAEDFPNMHVSGVGFRRVIHLAGRESFAWGMYGPPKWKPSIHMPRTGCRLTLEITAIRAERLQDISRNDCVNEGIRLRGISLAEDAARVVFDYADLWESINGEGSWAANPWVWVIEFKPI